LVVTMKPEPLLRRPDLSGATIGQLHKYDQREADLYLIDLCGGHFTRALDEGAVQTGLLLMSTNDGQISFEFFPADVQRTHVRPDDVLAKISVHFDDHRPNHASPCHDEVIALCARLHAAGKLANVSQFLPGDSLHAIAPRTGCAS
ncbi:MAG TPA: hypothetical protein VN605_10250, partial [Thermoanaerobaculia bacterium]|nr:hypothetical protein [Thermoanaerobaculia bacterium]